MPPTESGGHVDDHFLFVKNEDDMRYLWCIVKSFENDTNTDVPQAKVQSYLLCYSDQAIYRENQWNKFLGFKDCLTDFKAFRIGFSSTLTVRLKVKSFTNSGPSFLFVLFVLCFGTNCNVKTFT